MCSENSEMIVEKPMYLKLYFGGVIGLWCLKHDFETIFNVHSERYGRLIIDVFDLQLAIVY